MRTVLKILMFIFGAILVIEGLQDIIMPEQRATLLGAGASTTLVSFFMTLLGATWMAAGFWIILAGRDPMRHIYWLRVAITLPILLMAALIFTCLKGYISFEQITIDLIVNGIFTVGFLVFYPWRKDSA